MHWAVAKKTQREKTTWGPVAFSGTRSTAALYAQNKLSKSQRLNETNCEAQMGSRHLLGFVLHFSQNQDNGKIPSLKTGKNNELSHTNVGERGLPNARRRMRDGEDRTPRYGASKPLSILSVITKAVLPYDITSNGILKLRMLRDLVLVNHMKSWLMVGPHVRQKSEVNALSAVPYPQQQQKNHQKEIYQKLLVNENPVKHYARKTGKKVTFWSK